MEAPAEMMDAANQMGDPIPALLEGLQRVVDISRPGAPGGERAAPPSAG